MSELITGNPRTTSPFVAVALVVARSSGCNPWWSRLREYATFSISTTLPLSEEKCNISPFSSFAAMS
uniref:Uncharacterized protein n=1 Tax=Anguilla anguilla TaxID=7936 RepID=A0A0E9V4K8_ANGAN